LGIGEILTYTSATIFVLGIVTFAIGYRRVLLQTMEEYENAEVVLQELISTIHKLKDGKGELRVQRVLGVNVAQTKTTHETVKLQMLERKLVSLTRLVQTSSASDRELMTHMMEMQREVQNLRKKQEVFQRRINTLNEKIQQVPRLEKREMMLQTEEQPFSRITETERLVLNLLVKEGSMTASKMEKKIGKTREHTARLMKKLWQEGYIERDTHRKPFTYRPTKKLKKKTRKKKAEKIASTITKNV